jgi:hypothetical protein
MCHQELRRDPAQRQQLEDMLGVYQAEEDTARAARAAGIRSNKEEAVSLTAASRKQHIKQLAEARDVRLQQVRDYTGIHTFPLHYQAVAAGVNDAEPAYCVILSVDCKQHHQLWQLRQHPSTLHSNEMRCMALGATCSLTPTIANLDQLQVLTQHEARQQAALEAKAQSAQRTQLRREQRAAEAAATAAAAAHQQQVGQGSSCTPSRAAAHKARSMLHVCLSWALLSGGMGVKGATLCQGVQSFVACSCLSH